MRTSRIGISFRSAAAVGVLVLACLSTLVAASAAEWPDTRAVLVSALLYPTDEAFIGQSATLQGGAGKVMQLKPVSFTWKDGPRRGEPDIGFIAQEVEQIVPEVVHTDSSGMKSVDYPKLIPILVKAIQENQADIDALKTEVIERRKAIEANTGVR